MRNPVLIVALVVILVGVAYLVIKRRGRAS